MNQEVESLLSAQIKRGIFPQAYLFWGDDEDAKEKTIIYILTAFLGEHFKANPNFFEFTPHGEKGRGSISLGEIHDLKMRANEKPFNTQSGTGIARNIFLIRDIDLLGRDAAPALLKILEEPPKNTIFLATTTNCHALLPTIRSRFLMLRFWRMHISHDLIYVPNIRTLSFYDRFKKVPAMVESNDLATFIREAIITTAGDMRAQALRSENITKSSDALVRLLAAYRALLNPTVNKRLLGEYCMMLI